MTKQKSLTGSKVSVIMPAYNSESFIHKAIRSVMNQTHTNWELWIIDDGSSDKTGEVVKKFLKADKRISYIKTRNGGPGNARNVGIANSSGRFVAFLDSDDEWHPEKLEATLDYAHHHTSALTFTSYIMCREVPRPSEKIVHVPGLVDYKRVLISNPVAMSTVLVDRQKVPGFTLRGEMFFDDYVAWLDILRKGVVAYGLDRPLTRYRVSNGSFSSNKFRAAREVLNVMRNVEGLSWVQTSWFFGNYTVRGIAKHIGWGRNRKLSTLSSERPFPH